MKAAVFKGKAQLSVEEIPEVPPKSGEVQLRVSHCGICGTDLHYFAMGNFPTGKVLGHEFSGRIEALGDGVTGWQIGDRVVPVPYKPCGKCYWCTHSQQEICTDTIAIGMGQRLGALSEMVTVDATTLFPIPDTVSDAAAAVTEPLAVALHAVRRSKLQAGDSVAIFGAGPIGLLVLQCAKLAGARAVYVCEVAERRKAAARELGAKAVIDPRQEDVRASMTRLTGIGPDIVFECAGAPTTLDDATRVVRGGGRVVLVGIAPEAVTLKPKIWVYKQIEVTAVWGYWDEFPQALEFLAQGRFVVDPLITRLGTLDEAQACFSLLSRANDEIKILLKIGGQS